MTIFSYYSFRIIKISPYINLKNSLAGFGALLRAAPGGSCPPAPPRYATEWADNISMCPSPLSLGRRIVMLSPEVWVVHGERPTHWHGFYKNILGIPNSGLARVSGARENLKFCGTLKIIPKK